MPAKRRAKAEQVSTRKTDFSAELLNVEDQDIAPQAILLDPNNPRFMEEDAARVPDEQIPRLQDRTMQHIREEIGIEDVKDKIASLGYQRHERIFIRPLKRDAKKRYVVLEGNRRVASVKTLLDQIKKEEVEVTDAVKKSLDHLPTVIYHGEDEDIAWLVQGLRHISAIKRWDPIQQARFIEKAAAQSGKPEIEIGKQFGVSSKDTAKLTDALHLFRQAKQNREYGDLVDDAKFAMFHEGVFDKRATLAIEFLGYDEKAKDAKNEANLTRLLGLITSPDPKTSPKIRRAIDVRDKLPRLIAEKDLFDKVVDGELELDRAEAEAISRSRAREEQKFNVDQERERIETALDYVTKLPATAIALDERYKGRFVTLLRKMAKMVEAHLKLLGK